MNATRLPADACPHCRTPLDAATGVFDPHAVPSPGDLTVCLYCGHVLTFDDVMRVRVMTVDEVAALPRDLVAQLDAAVRAARAVRGASH